MNISITVSIIIPTYNTAHFLSDAIGSVLNSTLREFEIIVIDDGSIDNTEEVLTRYLTIPNFKFIQQGNMGLAGARNTGVRAASGKYLVFLDSDDIILPSKLEKQVSFLEQNLQFDAVYSSSVFFKDTAPEVKVLTGFPNYSGYVLKNLLYGNFIHVNAIMVRKKAVIRVGMFDDALRELEDWDLWIRMSIAGSCFYYQDCVLSEVRLRKGSMTSNQQRMNKTMVRVLEKNFPALKESTNYDKSLIKCAHEAILLYRLKAGESEDYNLQIFKAFKEVGLPFLPIASKLFIKRYASVIVKFENKTTKNLEKVWDE